jgi:hypothetical protein
MTTYTSALYQARELAMGRLHSEAVALHADGVVGVDISERPHVWGSHVIEFFAIGTAIASESENDRQLDPTLALYVHDEVVETDPAGILGSSENAKKADLR